MPAHGLAEVAEVLRRNARDGVISAQHLHDAVASAAELVELSPVSELLPRAVALGLELDISIYDSLYVALAEREDTTVVTWDQRLLRRVAASPYARLVTPLDPSWAPT